MDDTSQHAIAISNGIKVMAKKLRQLITSDEAKPAKCQHKKPCSDCPWARKSIAGWLGGLTVQQWIMRVHSDDQIACHTLKGVQCAGAAIYRANVFKLPRDPECLKLPADRKNVFGFNEFEEHHGDDSVFEGVDIPEDME
jgi:hypothetical protein